MGCNMRILLWHHFRYYQHKVILVVATLLLPVCLLGCVGLGLYLLNEVVGNMEHIQECKTPPVRPTMAAGSHTYIPYEMCGRFNKQECVAQKNTALMTNLDELLKKCKKRTQFICGLYNTTTIFPATGRVLYVHPKLSSIRPLMDIVKRTMQGYVDQLKQSNQFQLLNTSCISNAGSRLLGFKSLDEAVKFTNKKKVATPGKNDWDIKLWGILNFKSKATDMDKGIFDYEIIIDSVNGDKVAAWQLQSMVESAMVQIANKRSHRPSLNGPLEIPAVTIDVQDLSSKCWTRISQMSYKILHSLLPFILVFSFFLSPYNALQQMTIEKELQLRDYLGIMGISKLELKASWWAFYMLFPLLPLAGLATLGMYLFPYAAFGATNMGLVLVLLILFNTATMSWVFFFSTISSSSKTACHCFLYVHVFLCLVVGFLVGSLANQNGVLLVGSTILSFHPVVPLWFAVHYAVAWEESRVGLSLHNAWLSPFQSDKYGGFAMCLTWLLLDSVLYMVLAWYVDQVFPGEFGTKRKPYFCFQSSYWKSGTRNASDEVEHPSGDVELPENKTKPGLKLSNLTKVYNNGHVGLSDLSIEFAQSELIGLLGLNGAGKSTTLNSIVGLISPTGGEIFLNGSNINSIKDVHRKVSFVPQHNILYPALTLEDHLYFYGSLKSKNFDPKSPELVNNLKALDLFMVKNIPAEKLSGGQKRKLSLLLAYIGDPSVVILDEPTSGVDPQSRKIMWDFILRDKESRTTILSTHHLQEADLLSDKVAIISGGTLNCYGTTHELRTQYDVGQRFLVATNGETCRNEIIQLFDKNLGLHVATNESTQMTFPISAELAKSEIFLKTLAVFEEHKTELKYDCYGLSSGSLEEVFFKATGLTEPVQVTSGEITKSADTCDAIHQTNKSWINHFFASLLGLIVKRLQFFRRSWTHIMYQFFAPLSYVLLLLLIGKIGGTDDSSPYITLEQPWLQKHLLFFAQESNNSNNNNNNNSNNNSNYNNNNSGSINSNISEQFFSNLVHTGLGYACSKAFQEKAAVDCPKAVHYASTSVVSAAATTGCKDCRNYCSSQESLNLERHKIPTNQIAYRVPTMAVADWMLTSNDSEHLVIGGFVFGHDRNKLKVVAKPRHVPAMINAANNAILRATLHRKRAAIRLSIKLIKLDSDDMDNLMKMPGKIAQIYIGTLFLMAAFITTTFGVINFIMLEKTSGLKRLQRIGECGVLAYWLANFLADFVLFCCTFIGVVVLIAVIPSVFSENLALFCLLMAPFGPASITFVYFISYFFNTSSSAQTFVNVSTIVLVMFGIPIGMELFYVMCSTKGGEGCMFGWIVPLNVILRLFPVFYLVDALTLFAFILIFSIASNGLDDSLLGNIYDMNLTGKFLVGGCASFVLYFCLILLLEKYNVDTFNWCALCKNVGSSKRKVQQPDGAGEPSDIGAEHHRVLDAQNDDILLVQNDSKTYPFGNIAVEPVSFGVPQKQCFGLLGTNGAGKTTLFKMLTGYLPPTQGKLLMNGADSTKILNLFSGQYSYCPQEKMLFDFLTVTEHLTLFARLKGIPRRDISTVCQNLIEECELADYATKLSKQLSGGNQRKLQLAISLIGHPPIIFLDEPTTGMDPFSRKRAWAAIHRVCSAGSAVVLTSHTMEECEALCHRILILVAGKARCIGGIQKLKDSLGNSHVVSLFVRNLELSTAGPRALQDLKQELNVKFPHSRILEENFRLLKFDVDSSSILLSKLLSDLLELQRAHPFIADYSVSQLTFEEVFVTMAGKQNAFVDSVQRPSDSPQ